MKYALLVALLIAIPVTPCSVSAANTAEPLAGDPVATSRVLSLDGEGWFLTIDPDNVGREEHWEKAPAQDAKTTHVPWVIDVAFPGYDGLAWYWKSFTAPPNPHEQGRTLLRFWAVDFKADVWLNGEYLGSHEGGETPFYFDVTDCMKPRAENLLAVRVLNPSDKPIDGITLQASPHSFRVSEFRAGSAMNHGGILDSVEVICEPAVRIEDVFAKPDLETGEIVVETTAFCAADEALPATVEVTVGPAASGETCAASCVPVELTPGKNVSRAVLKIEQPRLWQLDDPYLYRVSVRLKTDRYPKSFAERSVRIGFREFTFRDGYFRLNGKRIFLKCSHTCNHTPIGLRMPHDEDIYRRDLINCKAMGFNAIRFIMGMPARYQLELADEIGLMVYEEPLSAWQRDYSPQFEKWFDDSVRGMILRDRNHPSVVIWGLLNETNEGPLFRHAVDALRLVRELDDSRMVMLNSGRWDNGTATSVVNPASGRLLWRKSTIGSEPFVGRNEGEEPVRVFNIAWPAGALALHPGPKGEYAVVRWTAPKQSRCNVDAAFSDITVDAATTDVHVLHNGSPLFEGFLNLDGRGREAKFGGPVLARKGDTIDFVVGQGNAHYGGDSTGLAATIALDDGTVYQANEGISTASHGGGGGCPWDCGMLAPGGKPKAETFVAFDRPRCGDVLTPGTLSNPYTSTWDDTLCDRHPYRSVPHTADDIRFYREVRGYAGACGGLEPYFPSEYGIGSGVNWARVVRLFEQNGCLGGQDCQFYRSQLERFLADYRRWNMESVFGTPEGFFRQSLARNASQRTLGLNALRSNPHVVGYSLTGTVDQVLCGEGLTTTFRELKPGTVDAVFEGFAPLRWCTFVEPLNLYSGGEATFEAVLANEDVVKTGSYPARVAVFDPDNKCIVDRPTTVNVPAGEPRFALPVFKERIRIDGPSGCYRFEVFFEKGAAASGGMTEFHVFRKEDMPLVRTEVCLWGEDAGLRQWLDQNGIKTVAFDPGVPVDRKRLFLAGATPPPQPEDAFADLTKRIKAGSAAVFLQPAVFRAADDSTAFLPLEKRGAFAELPAWLYHVDQWAARHPIFAGLQSGGLMDYAYYREIIPKTHLVDAQTPDSTVAAGNDTSSNYCSGLMTAIYQVSDGRILVNTLLVRENLGVVPQAERLLRNMLIDLSPPLP